MAQPDSPGFLWYDEKIGGTGFPACAKEAG
jgi:hypothetical protein